MKQHKVEFVTGHSFEGFCKNLESALNKGWKSIGQPIFVDHGKDCRYFVQFVRGKVKV